MNLTSELTDKIVAFTEIPDFNTDDCVDWAVEMISLGHDTPDLLIIAGLSKPTNYFETIEYLKIALRELKLEPKTGISGISSYSKYFINQIAAGVNVKENLSKLVRYCLSTSYDVHNFNLLYWAWGDLDYGNTSQDYWPEANIGNIEHVVIEKAIEWQEENK